MVLPGEQAHELQKPDRAWELLRPWGVTPDNAELERSAVYRFQARWAKEWHKGRCLIGGDAAHLMPPFAGEGMCAGVRDAVAMAWRLNGILEGKFGTDILASYTSERIEHAKHYISFSQELGQIICIADDAAAAERDAKMIAGLAASAGKPVPTDICQLGQGAWCDGTAHAGELSAQGVVEHAGKRDRFDQAVGQGWVLIGYDADPSAALSPAQAAQLTALDGLAVPADRLITGADAAHALHAIRQAAWLLAAAEAAGGIAGALAVTVDYLNTRNAFGRKIGSYQALKHGCADILCQLERVRSHVYHAATLLAIDRLVHTALANQKQHMSIYLHAIYGDDRVREEFEEAYRATGKRYDVGKSCVRFRRLDDLPLDVVGEAVSSTSVEELIAQHKRAMGARRSRPRKRTP